MPSISQGTVIAGRYVLDARLDQGGKAQVWSAEDKELNRPVAVKILLTPEGGDTSFVEAFRAEAQAEAKLKHPNIVEVFDWGHDGEANYIVMEMLEGHTVGQILEGEGHMEHEQVVNVGRQAASALAYAHAEGVAHGNIKDHRIMVGPSGHATILGFGLQCRGACEYPATPDADTYALGGVLYLMLTGASPFGPRPVQVPENQPWPEPAHKLVPGVPSELDRVVTKAVQPDPAERYQTAAALQADLDEIARPKSRAWLWWTLGILAVLVAVAATFVALTLSKPVVPDVVGKSQADATAALQSAGMRTVVTGQEPSAVVAQGLVVRQSPAAGTKVNRNAQVGIVLSSGKPSVAVPSVSGMTLENASSTLTSAGLVVGTVDKQNSTTFPSGTVISQTPAGGGTVTVGTTINLVVSAGQALTTVPDVRGDTQATATNRLSGLGFKVDVGQAFASQSAGTVVSQSPAPGTSAPSGSTVSISVSQGPAPIKVPNVVNATTADAVTALQNLGLVPVSQTTSGTAAQKGFVISQEPDAGTKVSKGSQVVIVSGR